MTMNSSSAHLLCLLRQEDEKLQRQFNKMRVDAVHGLIIPDMEKAEMEVGDVEPEDFLDIGPVPWIYMNDNYSVTNADPSHQELQPLDTSDSISVCVASEGQELGKQHIRSADLSSERLGSKESDNKETDSSSKNPSRTILVTPECQFEDDRNISKAKFEVITGNCENRKMSWIIKHDPEYLEWCKKCVKPQKQMNMIRLKLFAGNISSSPAPSKSLSKHHLMHLNCKWTFSRPPEKRAKVSRMA